MDKTRDVARYRWRGVLAEMGIPEKALTGAHCPCPKCGGKDRFRFDDKEGHGTWFCSHCGAGNGFKLLELVLGGSFREISRMVDGVVGNVQQQAKRDEISEEEKYKRNKRILSETRAVYPGDPVAVYLLARCGIHAGDIPVDIRVHDALPHPETKDLWPCMVSVVRDKAGNGVALHRTFITKTGEKAPVGKAKMFTPGSKMTGACIRMHEPIENGLLGIAEGIETALAARTLYNGMPVWSATNAMLLQAWEWPEGLRHIVIFGDNDDSFTGHAAAYALARRARAAGLGVTVEIPETVGQDWCDVYAAKIHV